MLTDAASLLTHVQQLVRTALAGKVATSMAADFLARLLTHWLDRSSARDDTSPGASRDAACRDFSRVLFTPFGF